MPKIDDLSVQQSSQRFKRSNYRPWNYMDEVEKEITLESNVNLKIVEPKSDDINNENHLSHNDPYIKAEKNYKNKISFTPDVVNQKENNLETTLDKIFSLTGHQKNIFIFIVERCISRGVLNTSIVKMETLSEITATSFKMVKLSIKRLIIKQLINRNQGKKGRGGFHAFSITEITRNAFLEYRRLIVSNENNFDKAKINNQTKLINDANISRSEELPVEWKNINIELLKDIGFAENHLKQLYYKKLNTPDIIEESIKHFSFALLNNPKVKQYQDPLNVLIGVLRKGQAWVESNYKSPQEIALIELLLRKKTEQDRLILLEQDAYEVAFKDWQIKLNSEDLEKIIPNKSDLIDKSQAMIPKKVRLKMFFDKNIWPNIKKEYLIFKEETENN